MWRTSGATLQAEHLSGCTTQLKPYSSNSMLYNRKDAAAAVAVIVFMGDVPATFEIDVEYPSTMFEAVFRL